MPGNEQAEGPDLEPTEAATEVPEAPIPDASIEIPKAESCGACGEQVRAGANWCEACGHDLVNNSAPPVATVTASATASTTAQAEAGVASGVSCQACGESDVDDQGYCLSCGYRQPSERNHVGEVVGPIAAATDRGSVRHRNEDAFAVAMADRGQAVLVVCDGVSSTPGSEEAATSAASVACQVVTDGLNNASSLDGKVPNETAIEKLLITAVDEAQQAATAAAELIAGPGAAPLADPPSTTLVCAVVASGVDVTGPFVNIDVAWVGDSRCYWVSATSEELLTTDHEELGALSRWLGADSIQPEPDVARHRFTLESPTSAGWVLACSDGLWRYLTPSTGMTAHELLAGISHNASASSADKPGELAEQLVDGLVTFANNRGGHDNITAALMSPTIDSPEPIEESQ